MHPRYLWTIHASYVLVIKQGKLRDLFTIHADKVTVENTCSLNTCGQYMHET
jgi:hypothetical protein